MITDINSTMLRNYCSMIRKAAVLGVPMEDLLLQTRYFHGDIFADAVKKSLHLN